MGEKFGHRNESLSSEGVNDYQMYMSAGNTAFERANTAPNGTVTQYGGRSRFRASLDRGQNRMQPGINGMIH